MIIFIGEGKIHYLIPGYKTSNLQSLAKIIICTLLSKKKLIWKGYILYDSNYIAFWNRQNYRPSKKWSVVDKN